MSTICQAQWEHFWKRILWLFLILALGFLVYFLTSSSTGALIEALTPPNLPQIPKVTKQEWLNQNWSEENRNRYHHLSQGTRTLPIPYEWFVGLEEPSSWLLGIPFSTDKKLSDDNYLLRFGFIKGKKSEYNPDGLPLGLAQTPLQNLGGLNHKANSIGFTCAACHTSQVIYGDTQYVIEGGSSNADLGQLTQALSAALGQTALSATIPFLDGRFDKFAKNVLKDRYSDAEKVRLKDELIAVVTNLKEHVDIVEVTEGYGRIDALNRIGNQVFSVDMDRKENYSPINAPVNFPQIWTSSWFNWVQYDGSIMQPMIRNAGEALGVAAYLDIKSPLDEHRFGSSVPINNITWIEELLAGSPPYETKKFSGLLSPTWPASFPAINQDLAKEGASLYVEKCQGCHLPALNSKEIWSDHYFGKINWNDIDGNPQSSKDDVLMLNIIPHNEIGTDTAQGNVLLNRTVDTSGRANVPASDVTPGIGLGTNICSWNPVAPNTPWEEVNGGKGQLVTIPYTDSGHVLFGLALGATVQKTIQAWYAQNYISPALQEIYQGDRPNCLQVGKGYKARPLNGIWATAPYLHNGSVPSLMDLLKPVSERPALVQMGSPLIDPENVGIVQDSKVKMKPGNVYAKNGLFILDTSTLGNKNSGHEFSKSYDAKNPQEGIIGPEFTPPQRKALVEYMKTL